MSVPPDGVLVPFTSGLPPCAAACYPLYDAQGACSPPVQPTSINCLCRYDKLQPFFQTTSNVCDAACPDDPTGLTKIQAWFRQACGVKIATPTAGTATGTATGTLKATGAAATDAAAGSSSDSSTDAGNWISNHYQYIIMLVVLLIGFSLLGVGLTWFRRRRARARDLQYEMRPPGAPWVQGQKGTSPYAYGDGIVDINSGRSNKEDAVLGINGFSEKKKQKWTVKERT